MIHQGDIYWIDLGQPIGSEPAYIHPYVVIQNDVLNRSGIRTVIVCALTTNRRRAIQHKFLDIPQSLSLLHFFKQCYILSQHIIKQFTQLNPLRFRPLGKKLHHLISQINRHLKYHILTVKLSSLRSGKIILRLHHTPPSYC
ncbi:MAG: type II toxin-antitoxin system PemK/MazF family toxin [Stigonema ocellatum SAG 48.90 = DSM 106950]|nr:type II toxin-antitoxin system PemK/MazF family toxin [Stigonema ocellatum SAG 48.90 = DSM 106950]